MSNGSFDKGEQLRVTLDGKMTLHLHHGAREIATIRRIIGSGGTVKVATETRQWRLTRTDHGWRAEGEPAAELQKRALRATKLTVGGETFTVRGNTVKDVLELKRDAKVGKPSLKGEILTQLDGDAEAIIVLSTAAVALDDDLKPSTTTTLDGTMISGAHWT